MLKKKLIFAKDEIFQIKILIIYKVSSQLRIRTNGCAFRPSLILLHEDYSLEACALRAAA